MVAVLVLFCHSVAVFDFIWQTTYRTSLESLRVELGPFRVSKAGTLGISGAGQCLEDKSEDYWTAVFIACRHGCAQPWAVLTGE